MKTEAITITGSTDSNGLFTAKNPYSFATYGRTEAINANNFRDNHPPLFCYNENNDLVKGVEGLEVKLQRQYYSNAGVWINYEYSEDFYLTVQGYETRMIYIAVQPTEKAEDICIICDNSTIDKSFCADCGLNKADERPLPEAQPLEGVKFTHPFRVGRKQNRAVLDANGLEVVVFKDGLQDMAMNYCNMLNSQFATDAGGGKDVNRLAELSAKEKFKVEIAAADRGRLRYNLVQSLKHTIQEYKESFIVGYKLALTASSNNSSSEMVDIKEGARRKAYQIFLNIWGEAANGSNYDIHQWAEFHNLLNKIIDNKPFKKVL